MKDIKSQKCSVNSILQVHFFLIVVFDRSVLFDNFHKRRYCPIEESIAVYVDIFYFYIYSKTLVVKQKEICM